MWFFKKKKQNNGKIVCNKKVHLGLALGGGGVRGIGHIGAIKAFEELGLDFEYVAGTSAGSIVGALYSYGLKYEDFEEIVFSLKRKDIKKTNWFFMPSSTENIEETMKKIFNKDLMFSELKKPFCAIAVNMKNGEEVRLEAGSVAKAVCASSAVPGVFKPVVWQGMHLVDGGLTNNVPADVVREMGANVVIAIDVNPNRGKGTESLKLFSIMSSTVGVMMQKNIENKLKFADLVIIPALGEFSSTKLGDTKEMIERGYNAVMEKKNEIIALVSKKPKKRGKTIWHLKQKNLTRK